MPDIHTVVPTYNELENIQKLVPMLLDLPLDLGVIVVDDHSPDGTGDAADRLAGEHPGRVQVIHRGGKLGLGTAYIAGFKSALAQGTRLILTMDADFSHHPRYIPDMVAKIDEGYDLVIGSRYVPGGKMPDFPDHFKRRVELRRPDAAGFAGERRDRRISLLPAGSTGSPAARYDLQQRLLVPG